MNIFMTSQYSAPKIKVGVSSCLLGEKVRWDGNHKRDPVVNDLLGKFFEWVPTCPEVEIGMGIPRETVQLTGNAKAPLRDVINAIEDYRNGSASLIKPVTLIKRHVRKHNVDYLANQIYFPCSAQGQFR
jgi:uncharacterized protein YbbK (DUF523 family)